MTATDPALNVPYLPDQHAAVPEAHKLTARPSPLDPRDYLAALPTKVNLPPQYVLVACYDPLDQSQLGSCTANGEAGMYATELLLAGRPSVLISRLALYYAERFKEHSVDQDSGAIPRDGLLTMRRSGVGAETYWPYDIAKFTQAPPAAALADAPHHKIKAFYRISGLVGVKAALFAGHPVGIGMLVFNGMEASRNGVIPMPARGEQPLGGHFVYLRGWQDDPQWPGGGYGIMRNSWGATAGNGHGDYLIPYAYLGNTQLVSEFWHLQLP